MKIEIITKSKNRTHYFNLLAKFCCEELKILNSKFDLKIVFKKMNPEHSGSTINFEKDIIVELNTNNSLAIQTSSLCHEMIHVQQIARGLLKWEKSDILWRGQNLAHLKYLNQPWEILALQRTELLERKFLDVYKSLEL